MSVATRRTFPARTEGGCGGCTAPIHLGDEVFFVGNNELPVGSDCCGDRPDEELLPKQRADEYELPDSGLTVDDETPEAAIAKVMPRRRTRADMCRRCWQIPANNGSCGCDY